MKTIILFYTKAKAAQPLAGFYESCAQIEIDEYQNYEKALAAFKEAEKVLAKAQCPVGQVQYKCSMLSNYLHARECIQNVDECEAICAKLLNEPDINVQ
jgi:intraflagellar transport protein 140